MTTPPQPNPEFFEEYKVWLSGKRRAENTIKSYITCLKNIPEDVNRYLINRDLKGAKLKIVAYRSYLRFLSIEKEILDTKHLLKFLEKFKPPANHNNSVNEKLYSIPKSKWVQYIRHAPNKVAKMGIWIGFHFGLRLGEIIHLRILDVDFRSKNVLVRTHTKTDDNDAWNPKYNKVRNVPFTKEQEKVFKRWIREIRPKDLSHTYLLWNERGSRKYLRVLDKTFERWCKETGEGLDSRKFKPHIMRYSFATHFYEATKDIKLISDLLGHSDVKTTSDYLHLGQKETEDKARDVFERY